MIRIHLDMDDAISPLCPEIKLSQQPGFDPSVALELGNLTRVSYKDYDNYEKRKEKGSEPLLDPHKLSNKYISVENANKMRSKWYTVLNKNEQDKLIDISDASNVYEILDVFYYTSYNLWKILPELYEPNTSRFGFIAKQGNRIFVVFRGTQEPEEWVNNAQPHQISFLQRSLRINTDRPDVKVHWGFNKIYTKFHPGPFLEYPIPNAIFSSPGRAFRGLTDICARENAPKNYPSIWEVIEKIFKNSDYYSPGDQVFVTGHSLGGALATMAALHIACLTDCQPIVYTFASPTVGNSGFAKYFSEKVTHSFRIANTEDPVPKLALPGAKMNGYEHVDKPVVFTCQTGSISGNHNMNAIYCGVVENELKHSD
jgi:triacylglycerol lipase